MSIAGGLVQSTQVPRVSLATLVFSQVMGSGLWLLVQVKWRLNGKGG